MKQRAAGSGQRAVDPRLPVVPPPAARRPLPALILALMLVATCKEKPPVHDAAMRNALTQLRTAIAHFHDDNGRHPHSLDELVPRYLARIPADPVTGSATTWRLTTEESVQPSGDFSATAAPAPQPEIIEIHSGAPGTDSTGKRWSDY